MSLRRCKPQSTPQEQNQREAESCSESKFFFALTLDMTQNQKISSHHADSELGVSPSTRNMTQNQDSSHHGDSESGLCCSSNQNTTQNQNSIHFSETESEFCTPCQSFNSESEPCTSIQKSIDWHSDSDLFATCQNQCRLHAVHPNYRAQREGALHIDVVHRGTGREAQCTCKTYISHCGHDTKSAALYTHVTQGGSKREECHAYSAHDSCDYGTKSAELYTHVTNDASEREECHAYSAHGSCDYDTQSAALYTHVTQGESKREECHAYSAHDSYDHDTNNATHEASTRE